MKITNTNTLLNILMNKRKKKKRQTELTLANRRTDRKVRTIGQCEFFRNFLTKKVYHNIERKNIYTHSWIKIILYLLK